MKPSSAKNKGRTLQKYVISRILHWFNYLEPDDVQNRSMGAGGEDIMLSPRARQYLPVSFECKNVEKLNVWAAYQQASDNSRIYDPVLVMKKNKKKPLVVIDLELFLKLMEDYVKPDETD